MAGNSVVEAAAGPAAVVAAVGRVAVDPPDGGDPHYDEQA